jgi:hypothetical protein
LFVVFDTPLTSCHAADFLRNGRKMSLKAMTVWFAHISNPNADFKNLAVIFMATDGEGKNMKSKWKSSLMHHAQLLARLSTVQTKKNKLGMLIKMWLGK